MDNLLTMADLAVVLKVSPKTLQNRRPEDLPPAIILPGTKKVRRWRERDVVQWLARLPSTGVPACDPEQTRPRPGRPRRVV